MDGNFTIPRVMETDPDVWFEVSVAAIDSSGLAGHASGDTTPNKAIVTLDNNLSSTSDDRGIQIELDGQPKDTPYSFTGVTGITRTLKVPTEVAQTIDGQRKISHVFKSWSDGDTSAVRIINIPESNVTYTANYVPAYSPLPRTLTVSSQDLSGNELTGMRTTVRSLNGTIVKAGFTPLVFSPGTDTTSTYIISMADYKGIVFDHWKDNGSTNARRTITLPIDPSSHSSLSSNNIVAYYNTNSVESGFTPIGYNIALDGPTLTVKAVLDNDGSNNGGTALNMWTLIRSHGDRDGNSNDNDVSILVATVTASDYAKIEFVRWEDGSTNRVRTLPIAQDTTITAYYRVG